MSTYVFFNREHNILLCKVHQYAVSFKFIYRHFLFEHDLDLKVRQEVINYASQFATVEASELTYFKDRVKPVAYLSIVDAFQCQYEGCDKVQGTLVTIKSHCRFDHDWKVKDEEK